jgi:hypothetical protein
MYVFLRMKETEIPISSDNTHISEMPTLYLALVSVTQSVKQRICRMYPKIPISFLISDQFSSL